MLPNVKTGGGHVLQNHFSADYSFKMNKHVNKEPADSKFYIQTFSSLIK